MKYILIFLLSLFIYSCSNGQDGLYTVSDDFAVDPCYLCRKDQACVIENGIGKCVCKENALWSVPCGINNKGTLEYICKNGDWQNIGECQDNDENLRTKDLDFETTVRKSR